LRGKMNDRYGSHWEPSQNPAYRSTLAPNHPNHFFKLLETARCVSSWPAAAWHGWSATEISALAFYLLRANFLIYFFRKARQENDAQLQKNLLIS
jgi:hypothetical protein